MLEGSEFQTVGAATLKAREAVFTDLLNLTTSAKSCEI